MAEQNQNGPEKRDQAELPVVMDGIEVNPDDAYERDVVWRYTQTWQKMPRHRRTDQGWADLVLCARSELEHHRARMVVGHPKEIEGG